MQTVAFHRRHLRNGETHIYSYMRTQKLPGLSKASGMLTFSLFFLHYDLVYGISETKAAGGVKIAGVSYYLIYGIFETLQPVISRISLVNYYLDCRTSETRALHASPAVRVNFCLIYGASETEES